MQAVNAVAPLELEWLKEWHETKLRQCQLLEQKHLAAAARGPFRTSSRNKADYGRKILIHERAIEALEPVLQRL